MGHAFIPFHGTVSADWTTLAKCCHKIYFITIHLKSSNCLLQLKVILISEPQAYTALFVNVEFVKQGKQGSLQLTDVMWMHGV